MATPIRERLLDAWAALTYKPSFDASTGVVTVPSWVPAAEERRLRAYMLFQSYLDNISRYWIQDSQSGWLELDASERARVVAATRLGGQSDRREYGDAELLVETIVAAIVGEDATIRVDGAGEAVEEAGDGEAAGPSAADELQDWFDAWDDAERPMLAFQEAEADAVGLGDGVLVVGWDGEKGRARVTPYDPGFYFPVLDPAVHEDFPSKVHIAWQYETTAADGSTLQWVRRITWELVAGQFWDPRALDGEGDVATVDQQLPWNEGPTDVTCLMSDGTWAWNDLGTRKVDQLDPDRARWATNADGLPIRNLDLGIDFLPVVHLPNTPNRKGHYGKSSLLKVLQVLDDLQAADTDLALAARVVGTPPLSVEGTIAGTKSDAAGRRTLSYAPGMVVEGKATFVDASRNLDALRQYVESLTSRLSENSRLPAAVLGRVAPSDVPSGYALQLGFGPMESMIRKMRLVRAEKYPLVLKFVARLGMKAGEVAPSAELPAARLGFGPFLPTDRAAVVKDVVELTKESLLSRLTAVKALMTDAGLPIEDAEAELDRITREDFTGAKALADATGRDDDAAQYLQLDERSEGARPAEPPITEPPPAANEE